MKHQVRHVVEQYLGERSSEITDQHGRTGSQNEARHCRQIGGTVNAGAVSSFRGLVSHMREVCIDGHDKVKESQSQHAERNCQCHRLFSGTASRQCQRNADIGRPVHIGRHRAARSNLTDKQRLNHGARNYAASHIPQNQSDDQTCHEGPSYHVPSARHAKEPRGSLRAEISKNTD